MNERIGKLFEQALEEFKAENKYATIIVPDSLQRDFVGKFTELVVRECAHIAWLYDEPKLSGHGAIIANSIKEQFGVEE